MPSADCGRSAHCLQESHSRVNFRWQISAFGDILAAMRWILLAGVWLLPLPGLGQVSAQGTGAALTEDAAAVSAVHLPPGMSRAAGLDAGSGIAYTLISVQGKLVAGVGGVSVYAVKAAASELPPTPPTLTAQCIRDESGKLRFELLTNLGGIPEIAYYPPWKPTPQQQVQPPTAKTTVTMEFLGYMKVKPVKREWRYLRALPGELRYAESGMHSGNMEESRFYMQYLKALPTLRLTIPGQGLGTGTIEFETTKWQSFVRKEPLCAEAGL